MGLSEFFFSFFFFFLFFFFLFFRRQGFRMITFDRQAGPLQNFNRSHIMVIGRSVPTPRDPRVGAWGAPNTPKFPPPRKINFCLHAFQNPRNIFEKKILVGKKNSEIFRPPPPPQKKNYIFYFLGVLRPQEHFLAEIFFSVKNSTSQPPPPTCTPPPSPQNTHPNPRAIINNANNFSMTYRL